MDVAFDFSDVDKAIEDFKHQEVKKMMSEVGEEAVEYAKANGGYHDVTGNLRASNKVSTNEQELKIYNDADYASSVESRGYEVVTGAALFAEKRLKEIFE